MPQKQPNPEPTTRRPKPPPPPPMHDPIVGHKTFDDGSGGFRHEPLRESEANALWEAAKVEEQRRIALMPDEKAAISMLFDAFQPAERTWMG